MTADWWDKGSPAPQDNTDWLRSEWTPEPEPVKVPEGENPEESPALDSGRKRKLVVGAVWAAAAGLAVFTMMPDGESSAPQDVAAPQGEYLPPAGEGPSEAPAASPAAEPKVATLTFTPSGSGRVGAVVQVKIHNQTDDRLTLIANLVRGDDHPGVVGEGTLAPGAKVIEPGGTAEGTIEFADSEQPNQVVLMDLNGNIVAVG